MYWAQFRSAAKHKKITIKNVHVIFRISKQQLNTSNKQYATNESLFGNPVFTKEEISCLANVCAQQLYEIGPWSLTILPNECLDKPSSVSYFDRRFQCNPRNAKRTKYNNNLLP